MPDRPLVLSDLVKSCEQSSVCQMRFSAQSHLTCFARYEADEGFSSLLTSISTCTSLACLSVCSIVLYIPCKFHVTESCTCDFTSFTGVSSTVCCLHLCYLLHTAAALLLSLLPLQLQPFARDMDRICYMTCVQRMEGQMKMMVAAGTTSPPCPVCVALYTGMV